MWNSRSPVVETAWRPRARMSRNARNSAGRGGPESRSHASDPKPRMQEKAPFQVPEFHCAHQCRQICAEAPQDRAIAGARVYCRDQEDRGASERRGYWLRNGLRTAYRSGPAHRIGLHLNVILTGHAVLRAASGVRTNSRGCLFGRHAARRTWASNHHGLAGVFHWFVPSSVGEEISEASQPPPSALIQLNVAHPVHLLPYAVKM